MFPGTLKIFFWETGILPDLGTTRESKIRKLSRGFPISSGRLLLFG